MHATELAPQAQPHPPPPAPESPPPERRGGWLAVARRFGFRVAFVYLTLFLLPAFLRTVPGIGVVNRPYLAFWAAVAPWVGQHVFRMSGDLPLFPTGSGDTLYRYAEVLTHGLFALVAAAIWTALDRRSDNRLARAWILAFARYGLGITMFTYGTLKVFRLQFQPALERLIEPYGEFSPMGVLWSFMGQSAAYSAFTGAAELLGGVLLFFRRTTTLGALLLVGVLGNVLVLNLSYDVPVKLYSAHLVGVALFLAAQDLRRVLAVFVLNRAAPPAPEESPVRSRRLGMALAAAGWLLGAATLFSEIRGSLEMRAGFEEEAAASPLSGLYQVESIQPGPGSGAPSILARTPWQKVAGNGRRFGILFADGTYRRFNTKHDPEKATLELTLTGTKEEAVLSYERPDAQHLVLRNSEMEVRLTRLDPSSFPLLNRGFHWVTDYPFNR